MYGLLWTRTQDFVVIQGLANCVVGKLRVH